MTEPTGFDVRETADVWLALTEAAVEIKFVSPAGGACRPIVPNRPSRAVEAFIASPDWGQATESTIMLGAVDPTEFELIYLVGGHGAMLDFWPGPVVRAAVIASLGAGCVVAAICHGVAGLLGARPDGVPIVSGHAVTAFSDAEEQARGLLDTVPFSLQNELISRGAHYTAGADGSSHVVVDGQLITAQNPYSTQEFSTQILQHLDAGTKRK
ncbi:type 1 glutamine amidotransferase domain-containing protein [Rothia nasisuis]|uniref:type 1 glutamine amidotransferase domain-containing protein n=1 Tax=Rothia nasisuis TaxID=2109647 RepID=UPI001F24A101|nr:type 1 glutamine amidotransferase domain-containing protein [Rothia nasisuis]